MPEGDSVYRATAQLHAALSGKRLSATDFRVPALATMDLSGYTLTQVFPVGKHLLMHFDPPSGCLPEAKSYTLHSHLLMEGRWDLYTPTERFKRPTHTARVILQTADVTAVGFNIAQVKLVPREDEQALIHHLGPDLLGPGWDAQLAEANFRAHPEREIGEALLDQRLMAGVGNIYRSEILFLTRLPPRTPIGQIQQLTKVIDMARRLLWVNKDRARRVTTGQARTREPYWVYGRTGKPCLRCGQAIQQLDIGEAGTERTCYYCAYCQPKS